ncbi:carbon storage regulator CsrA [Pseudomonas sp. YH-1]|uniref:carbon storage regulator CsrA n=1 Tax=Pseudomonas sp. YH-1 TaxID=3384787 RepID=UPI003F814FF9
MLILSRRPGETIRIGDEIEVTVLGIQGNQIRIGVKAPRSLDVHRQEVYERIHGVEADRMPKAVGE